MVGWEEFVDGRNLWMDGWMDGPAPASSCPTEASARPTWASASLIRASACLTRLSARPTDSPTHSHPHSINRLPTRVLALCFADRVWLQLQVEEGEAAERGYHHPPARIPADKQRQAGRCGVGGRVGGWRGSSSTCCCRGGGGGGRGGRRVGHSEYLPPPLLVPMRERGRVRVGGRRLWRVRGDREGGGLGK